MLPSRIYSEGFIGHGPVIDRLERLVQSKRMPHAVLLSGPDGVGKYFAARWFAAVFLALRSEEQQGEQQYRRAFNEKHPDLQVIRADKGKRDILISQVRDLLQNLSQKPFEASARSAIIDEADRMHPEAQQAFLKTLEEPPPNTLLVLVTAGPERLLPTIRSRCQRFRFSRLNHEEIQRFITQRLDQDPPFPETLAGGSPGFLLRLMGADISPARRLMLEFLASKGMPSPVKTTSQVIEWAEAGSETRNELRDRLRLFLRVGAGLLRDLALLKEGIRGRDILNGDVEESIFEAARLYELRGIFFIIREILGACEDIAGYVDPGLAVEYVFRVIRETRKRG